MSLTSAEIFHGFPTCYHPLSIRKRDQVLPAK